MNQHLSYVCFFFEGGGGVPGKIILFLLISASCTFNERMSHVPQYPGAKLANDLKKEEIFINLFFFLLLNSF